jgi:DNA primase
MHDPVVDEIKQRINIVEVVQEYLPLKKAGTNWKGLCPFHGEKTPSFMVSEDRMIFHCFGCGEGGDVFTFLQKIEGYDFPEVLKLLADRAGVKIERRDPRIQHERNLLSEIVKLSALFYRKVLTDSPRAERAREYLKERGLKTETESAFLIGFAPDGWETLCSFLSKRGYKEDDLVSSGMCLRSVNGRGLYDRFRNRIMFPIKDHQGQVVGFTGRLLPEDEKKPDAGGKYVNSPETPLYRKSSVLFALDAAKQEIRRQDLAVLVEGNMDVVSSHQAGVTNVVAASGTALTEDQLKLLGRYTHRLAVAFDADAAGDAAAKKGIIAALRNGFLVKVIVIPPALGKDPDDLVRKDPELWKQAIGGAVDIIDFLVASARAKFDLKTIEGKKAAVDQIVPIIFEVNDPVAAAHYVKVLSEAVGIPDDVIRGALRQAEGGKKWPGGGNKNSITPASKHETLSRARMLSERLMALYLVFPSVRPEIHDGLKTEYLEGDDLRGLYAALVSEYTQNNDPSPAPREERAKALAEILPLKLDVEPAENPKEESGEILNNLASLSRQAERERLEAEMRDAEKIGDLERISELMKLFKES